jgi:hypothetical protein
VIILVTLLKWRPDVTQDGWRAARKAVPGGHPLRQNRCSERKAAMSGTMDTSEPTMTGICISGAWVTRPFHV